ncbi:MAG: MFS transporter [Pirellulales bacterium]
MQPQENEALDPYTAPDSTAGLNLPLWERLRLWFLAHPIGFWFFFWGELAERCSYYGMRAILTLYMLERLDFSEGQAGATTALFIAGTYLTPLAGGWIADNVFGKYWTIVGFSLPYILGHVILGIESIPFLVIALVLLSMGSGVIKPNISTLMGMTYDQQRPGKEKLRSDAFAMFYWSINIGAAISSIAVPAIRTAWGYSTAFLFPAGLMVIAFAIFASGKKFYAVETISRTEKTAAEKKEQWRAIGRIAGIFAAVTFFWSIFDQSASTWVLFAKNYLDLHLWGVTLKPDQIQAANPILIIVMLPPVSLFWRFLAAHGLPLRATDKMLIGFILTAVTMAIMAAAGFLTSPSDKASVLWEVGAYVIITVAEICISVVGLELAFTAAPQKMKSFITACWLATVFLGNLLHAPFAYFYDFMPPGWYFALMTLMMVFVSCGFVFVARRFNRALPIAV